MSSAAAISSVVDESARDEPAPFDEDDPFDLPPPLPPLSPHRDEDEMNQNGDADGDQPDEGEGGKKESNAKRKVKRSPRPKLDEIRLCSDRGLPALTHLCDGVKFKGKGHEALDLKLLLQRYEYWAHRLFPKFPFADVVDQVEKLGSKKLVQNCIKRVRRGEHDTIDDGEKSDTEHDAQESVVSRDDGTQSQVPATPVSNNVQPFGVQVEPRNGMVILTPEQQERMRLNRERALAKRRAAQENQTAHENTQINDQTTVIEEPSSSNEVVETAKDVDSRTGNVGVENDSSAQANDIEMFDNQVDVTVDVSLPDDRSLESADGAGMGCENKNVREEDIEMENAETTTNLENSSDIAKNRENFPTVQDTNVSKGIKENDLSISVNEGDADSETTFHEDKTTSASRVEDIQREGAHETPETRPSEQGPAENGLDGDQNTEMEPES